MNKKLSICIPTYNRPTMILRAIESVLSQDYEDYELLIHDNSEDSRTEKSIKKFNDKRIGYYRHKKNIGLTKNWNSLIESSTGDYIKFLNDDDFLKPGCLSKFVSIIDSGIHPGIITCRADYIKEKKKNILKSDKKLCSSDFFVKPEKAGLVWLNHVLPVRTPTHSMYHRETALRLGGFDSRFNYGRDVFLALQLAEMNGAFFFEEETYVSFIKHNGQDVFNVPLDERVRDLHQINQLTFNKLSENIKEYTNIESINNAVILNEMFVSLKNQRYEDFIKASLLWVRAKNKFGGVVLFFKKNFLKKNYHYENIS